MIERRKQPRTLVECPVYFIGMDADGHVTTEDAAVALNINDNGMLIESKTFIKGRFIKIKAKTKGKGTIEVSGDIVYSFPSAEGKFRTGVAFEDPPEIALAFSDEMIQSSSVKDRSG